MKWGKGQSVCITGGAGFIGSNLAARLLGEGARVRVVDSLERGRREFLAPIAKDIEFVQADLREAEAARKAVQGVDVVFHLASHVGSIRVYLQRSGDVMLSNLLIDQNVFRAVIECGKPRLFYASSTHVYPGHRQASPDTAAFREADALPAHPPISYGWAKLAGELCLLALASEHKDLRVSIARIMGAYGYNQDIDFETGPVIPVFCHRAALWPKVRPFRIWGTGKEARSFCFIDDVVEGILRSVAAQDRMQVVGPFNLAAEGRATIREIAETVVRVSGKDIELTFDPSVGTVIWGQAADCSLARELLEGWEASVSLEEGIRRTYRHIEGIVQAGTSAR